MIRLHPDCLIIKMASGEQFPCPAELVTVELIGEAASWMSEEVLENVAAAVLHFFKEEQGRDVVSVAEFSEVLEEVLQGFGYSVGSAKKSERMVRNADISEMIPESEGELELAMYQRLRTEMERLLKNPPDELRFSGLRGYVKRVLHAQRWSRKCQALSDQIVAFLRECLDAHAVSNCSLVVKS